MADGSGFNRTQPDVLNGQETRESYITNATVIVGDSFLLDLGVPADSHNGPELRVLSSRLLEMTSASLQLAIARGDNPADMGGTLERAVEGAAVLLRLAMGLQDAAEKMEAPRG